MDWGTALAFGGANAVLDLICIRCDLIRVLETWTRPRGRRKGLDEETCEAKLRDSERERGSDLELEMMHFPVQWGIIYTVAQSNPQLITG